MIWNDADITGLNIFEEAAGEVADGRAAIARVQMNRQRMKFKSDGTVAGTVLARDQFSWAWFDFVRVHSGTDAHDETHQEYIRVSFSDNDANRRAYGLLVDAKNKFPNTFKACRVIGESVYAGLYHGTLYDQLTDDAVNYCNPRILKKIPAWAIPSKLIVSIGRHDFYRGDDPPPAMV